MTETEKLKLEKKLLGEKIKIWKWRT